MESRKAKELKIYLVLNKASPGLRALYVLQRNKPRTGSLRRAGLIPVPLLQVCGVVWGKLPHVFVEDLGRLMAEDPLDADAQSLGGRACMCRAGGLCT